MSSMRQLSLRNRKKMGKTYVIKVEERPKKWDAFSQSRRSRVKGDAADGGGSRGGVRRGENFKRIQPAEGYATVHETERKREEEFRGVEKGTRGTP